MAGDIKQKLGTTAQTFTITLAGLTHGSARQSTLVDMRTLLPNEVLVMLKAKTGAANTATTGYIQVYAIGTVDDSTTNTEGAGASDAAITLTVPTNAIPLGRINAVANATTYVGGPWSMASALGGSIPAYVGIIVQCMVGTSGSLDNTEGSHAKLYQVIYGQFT
jgi:hypothetical protein